MYNLRSSDISNFKYREAAKKWSPELLERYRNLDFTKVQHIILYSDITDSIYDNAMFALTLCDEFKVPVLKRIADLYFFILQINRAYNQREANFKITNLTQAQLCYEQSSGHFREITRQTELDPRDQYVTIKARHSCLFPECNITWQIPVGKLRDGQTGKTLYTVLGASRSPYALMSINHLHNIQIPRSLYIYFFEKTAGTGKITTETYDEVKDLFDEGANEVVYNSLIFAGLSKFKILEVDDSTDYYYSVDEQALIARILTLGGSLDIRQEEGEEIYWKKLNSREFRFLNKGAEYIPFIHNGNLIEILM